MPLSCGGVLGSVRVFRLCIRDVAHTGDQRRKLGREEVYFGAAMQGEGTVRYVSEE